MIPVQTDKAHVNTPPLVSVEMITYNHAPFIRRAVEGVLSQKTDFPFELVIGEDCSTDGTREIVFDYQKRFPNIIRVVTSESNVGMHENSGRTWRVCRGQYAAFCEGDDYWHDPVKLQRQVDYLESHPDCILVHSNCDLFYVETARRVRNFLPSGGDLNDEGAYEELLTRKRNIVTPTAITRREAHEAALRDNPECSDPKYLLGDMQMWLELSRLGKVKYLPESLATHNMLEESATHSRNPQKELQFALSARDLFYHYAAKYDCKPETAKAAKASATLFALGKAWKAGDAAMAKQLYREHCDLRRHVSPHALLLFLGSQSRIARAASVPFIAAYLSGRNWFATR
jgi:glycosyltransferase involved in cell wall biosynthesis